MAANTPERPRRTISQRVDGAKAFFQHEAAGGIVLLAAAMFGLALQNSPGSWLYDALLSTPVTVRIGALNLDKRSCFGSTTA